MKSIFSFIAYLFIAFSHIAAQNDTMYIMRSGQVISKYNVNNEVDSIIFYSPIKNIPTETTVSFTMGEDPDFHVLCTNTSTVTGSETWVVNGVNYTGKSISFHAPIPQVYNIKLTITTADGELSKEDTYTTTEPDLLFLNTPWVVALTGGYGKTKTWMVESAAQGHYGVSQWKRGVPNWWLIDPNERTTSESYDDELTFGLLNGATVTMQNGGKSYVNDTYQTADYFTNPVMYSFAVNEGWIVDYNTTALKGNWSFNLADSTLIITSSTPMFLGMYSGTTQYFVKAIDNHRIQVSCKGQENSIGEDGYVWWHYKWIEKGYISTPLAITASATSSDPSVSATMNVTAGAATEVTVNFGDGSAEEVSTDVTKAFTHTYLYNGVYAITFKAKDNEDGSIVTSYTGIEVKNGVVVARKTLDMYNDFDATETYSLVAAGDEITLDFANPSGSGLVAKVVSPATQWDNVYIMAPAFFTFDATSQVRMQIYAAEVGQSFTLEIGDPGSEPWYRGVRGLVNGSEKFVAGVANKWIEVVFDFSAAKSADGVAVATDAARKAGYYNKMTLFTNAGDARTTALYFLNDIEGNIVK